MSLAEKLQKAYGLGIWPEDPRTKEGYARYQASLNYFRKLLEHDWLGEMVRKKEITVLEICAGAGIGGVALARSLMDKKCIVKLILTDVREDVLRIGKKWGAEELGIDIEISCTDAREIHRLGVKADIILMYGYSATHFDPWEMINLLASVSETLHDDGLFIINEIDRVYRIFYEVGFKRVLPEKITEDKLIISIHAGYDVLRGIFRRAYLDLKNPKNHVILHNYYWNIAELAALIWLFFNDVDFVPLMRNITGFLLAKEPRRKIDPEDIRTLPRMIQQK